MSTETAAPPVETKPAPPVRQTRLLAEAEGGRDVRAILAEQEQVLANLRARAKGASEERAQLQTRIEELSDVLECTPVRAKRVQEQTNKLLSAKLAALGVEADLATLIVETPDPKRPNDVVVSFEVPS